MSRRAGAGRGLERPVTSPENDVARDRIIIGIGNDADYAVTFTGSNFPPRTGSLATPSHCSRTAA